MHTPFTTRRTFLKKAGAASVAALVLPATAACTRAASAQPIGIQLYTLRDLVAEDMQGTLSKIGSLGYSEVEFAGYFDHPLGSIKQWLTDSGLSAPSAHIRHTDFKDNFDAVLEIAAELGHKYLFLSWLPPEDRNAARYAVIAEMLNRNGEKAKAAGVQLGYHNHEFEFESLGSTNGYAILNENTDADLVKFELDIFWAKVAEVDIRQLVAAQPGRFPCVHVKDRGPDGSMVDVGDGNIDYAALYPALKEAGVQHFFIEHDSTPNPLKTAERSIKAFSRMTSG